VTDTRDDAPPRRYDVVDDQVAVGRPALGKRLRVRLDGRPVSLVRRYDQDKGEVTRILTDAAGRPVVDRALQCAREETLHGVVTVEWRDR
jgi:hypothetical protein